MSPGPWPRFLAWEARMPCVKCKAVQTPAYHHLPKGEKGPVWAIPFSSTAESGSEWTECPKVTLDRTIWTNV